MIRIITLLKANNIMRIATSANDNPRVSIVEYVMLDDQLVFATDPQSIKAKNLKANNKCSISIGINPEYVTIDGQVIAPSLCEIDEYNRILFEKHPEFAEYVENGQMRPLSHFRFVPKIAYYNDNTAGMQPTIVIEMDQ